MQKLLSFLEKSVQWVALGLAGVFLLLCVYWYLLTPPATKKVEGKVVTPGEIDALTQSGPVASIENDIKHGQSEPIHVADLIVPWTKQMNAAPPVAIASDAWHSFADGAIDVIGDRGLRLDLVNAVAVLPKATPLSAQAGLSVVAPVNGANGQVVQGAAPADLLWASAAFVISAKDLQAAFEKPLEKKDPDFKSFYRTAYLSIELQRQRATGHDANGTPTFPADDSFTKVEIARVNQSDIQPLPDAKAARETKNAFAQWAEANEMNIRQPKFYTTQAGSAYAPAVLVGQPGAPAAAAAAPAGLSRPIIGAPDANPAGGIAKEAGINPLQLTTDQLVWAHDDTVESGRSYRYRIVYHLKNPVFALENIADAKIIDQLDIASPPSDWSGPVTIPPNVQYWVTSVQRSGASALIDHFKWESGSWKYTKGITLSPGDNVPGTDQTLVDIHNVPGPRPKDQYVLLTDSLGESIRRIPKIDRDDSTHKGLLKETDPDAAVGGAVPRGGAPAPTTPRTAAPGAGRTSAMPTR